MTNTKVDYFSSKFLRKNLRSKTARGGLVIMSAQLIKISIGLFSVPILARLLGPEQFGLVAMVAVFTNFSQIFVNAGLSNATVQRNEITHQQVSNLFWLACILGCTVGAIVATLSPAISRFYDEPKLVGITLALASSYLILGLSIQHQALLQRGMEFKKIAVLNIGSQLISQVAGIYWAWKWHNTQFDYWALVLIPIVYAIVRTVLIWLLCQWRPSLPKRGAGTLQLITFGANLTGFNFVNYFARNSDNLLIGRFWGETELGYYDRAYSLLLLPMRQIAPILTSIVTPSLSRITSEPIKYRSSYISAVRILGWSTVPIVGLLFAISEPLVLLYLGPNWIEVIPLFQALTPAAWASAFVSCSGWVFTSWGHVNRQFRWGLVHSVLIVATVAICVSYGPLAVCYGLSFAYVLLRVPGFYICFRGTPIKVYDVTNVIWRPTITAFIAGTGSLLIVNSFSLSNNLYDAASHAKALIAGSIFYVVLLIATTLIIPGGRRDIETIKMELHTSLRKTSISKR